MVASRPGTSRTANKAFEGLPDGVYIAGNFGTDDSAGEGRLDKVWGGGSLAK